MYLNRSVYLNSSKPNLTTGCTYRVVWKTGKLISIINDDGVERTYSSRRFIEQTQEKENNMQAKEARASHGQAPATPKGDIDE